MLMYPSKDDLLKNINSDYSLVILAAKRAHEIREYQHAKKNNQSTYVAQPMLEDFESLKPVGMALEEIASGDIVEAPYSEPTSVDTEDQD